MIKLNAIKSDKIWGYELWIASTHPNGCQKDLEKFVGGDYPLLVKVIQANDKLSVQVHPDDETAQLYEHCRGKTECWYVLSADKDTQLVHGMNGIYSASEIRKAIETNSLSDFLRYVKVEAGDFIYIPAGTVHAIGGGLRLLEVQQSSDITYRLFDWGRGRECHIEKGIASIKSGGVRSVSKFPGVFSCPYFLMEEITVESSYITQLPGTKSGAADDIKPSDYALFFVIDGEGEMNGEKACKEDIFAFAPGEELKASGNLHIMKILPATEKRR
ncbi:MAG: class I mannose-6-phosphate isomerase [Treponema sp.]|nr:class I mannose-6-phosphate isomerase [Treponema sp.]